MKLKLYHLILPVAALAVLPSCHLYKEYEMPVENSAIMGDYKNALQDTDSTTLAHLSWQEVFTDPQLQQLIQTALDANRDLANAKLNIDIAQAQLKGAKLAYFPSVAFSPNGGAASYGGSDMSWSYTLPLAANWEVDVFGKLLNNKRKAQVNLEQSMDYEQAVRSQIICSVANTYYAIAWLQQQLDLTERTCEIWKEQVTTMEDLKAAARVNEAAVVQSRANYYNIASSIPDIKSSIAQLQNTMSILLGSYPKEWAVGGDIEFNMPACTQSGVPLYYLAVRPDVRAAERSVAAAYYTTNIARSNFYPSLNISAQGGFTNALGAMVSNPGKWFIQLGASLVAPIFSRGQNIATLRAAEASQKQALNTFESTVLSAAADVSDAIVKINAADQKRQMILQQIDQLEKAVEYTEDLMQFGQTTTYLEILTARSALLNAQLASLSNIHDKASALISLYQAVGGGY